MRDVRPLDQRTARDHVNDAASPEKGCEIEVADARAVSVVVQGCIGMRADVR